MGKKSLQVKGYTSEEIFSLFRTEPKYKIGLRLYAVYQVSTGQPTRKLEVLYNTSFKQICNWVHRFENEGIDGLRDKKKSGRKPKINDEQKARLSDLLEESPISYGYNTETWTGPIIIDWIKKNFKVEYKKAQIYNILKDLEFTYQKARGSYPEADKKAQEEFKKNLKKNFYIVL